MTKENTNKRWVSTKKYKEGYDTIFGEKEESKEDIKGGVVGVVDEVQY